MHMEFNLLPWRQEKRQDKVKSNTIVLLISFLLGLTLVGGYYYYLDLKHDDAKSAISIINDKNKSLQPELNEREELLNTISTLSKKINAIISLQANRPSVAHMVEELSKANDQSLFITDFVLNAGDVDIKGIAKDDSHISSFMKSLNNSSWYREPVLIEIVAANDIGEEVKSFRVKSKLLFLGEENQGNNNE